MNETRYSENHCAKPARLSAEIKEVAKDFVQTRVEMFKSEVRETLDSWKTACAASLSRSAVAGDCLLIDHSLS